MIEFRLLDENARARYGEDVLALLRAANEEFVPPLSARFEKEETDARGRKITVDGVLRYFEEMWERHILGAFEDGVLLGFVAFVENMRTPPIPEDSLPNIYISTVIVCASARGRRLTGGMYDYLFDTLYPHHSVFTRTWSTNVAHQKILARMGFSTLCRIENDRAEGIDTVYFCKRRD